MRASRALLCIPLQRSAGVRRHLNGTAGRCRSSIRTDDMTLKRMDNVGIVVESLDTAIAFFAELGMKLEGCLHAPHTVSRAF